MKAFTVPFSVIHAAPGASLSPRLWQVVVQRCEDRGVKLTAKNVRQMLVDLRKEAHVKLEIAERMRAEADEIFADARQIEKDAEALLDTTLAAAKQQRRRAKKGK